MLLAETYRWGTACLRARLGREVSLRHRAATERSDEKLVFAQSNRLRHPRTRSVFKGGAGDPPAHALQERL